MKQYCPYCMTPVRPGRMCPACKQDPAGYRPSPHHFPPGKLLNNRYLVGKSLGEGGFGITYLGRDTKLERRVAVKEYFPGVLVYRDSSASREVACHTGQKQNLFERGREQFLQEARVMARFDRLPEIVRVMDYFAENNTAYIVMEFLKGDDLRTCLEKNGRIPAKKLLEMMEPLLRAVNTIHDEGIIHRDISPGNIMLLENGQIKLLDFGCARDVDEDNTMTVMLKNGYAPVEQYTRRNQGPWTDIYALCATFYHCLTGRVPPHAVERIGNTDPLVPPNELGAALTPGQEDILLRGLAVEPKNRLRSVAELYGGLYGTAMKDFPQPPENTKEETEESEEETEEKAGKKEPPQARKTEILPQVKPARKTEILPMTETGQETKFMPPGEKVPEQIQEPFSLQRNTVLLTEKWKFFHKINIPAVVCCVIMIFAVLVMGGRNKTGTPNQSNEQSEGNTFKIEAFLECGSISAGSLHTVGLKNDGTVVAAGRNSEGQCDVDGWSDIIAVAAGHAYTVGLKSDGTVTAAGANRMGSCDVNGWTDIAAISAGLVHTVGLKTNGTVVAVGYEKSDRDRCDVGGWTNITAIAAGYYHTVGLKSNGTVAAVGANDWEQCDVGGWTDIAAISVGQNHTIGLKTDCTVVATGYNSDGRCNVTGWTDIAAISAGGKHTVGLKTDGTVTATGDNEYGQCDVDRWTNIVAISAGDHHTVGLKSDGTVVAVGYNKNGQCGVEGWSNIRIPGAEAEARP